jgi:2-methylcitrate dehydratase PrpD
VTRDAALTKRMQPGFAAMAALLSVQLTQRGVSGVKSTFEGADGFLRVYLRGQCDVAVLRDGLGQRFEFTQLSYKPYPCCRFNHNAIDATLALRGSAGRRIEGVKRVRVGLNRQAYEAVCTPIEMRKSPRSIVQAQFSIPYTVAAALVDGGVRLEHFTDAALQRQDILALAAKVEPYIDNDIEHDFGRNVSPAIVQLELEDGSTDSNRVDVPLGHPDRPMSAADFDTKARDCFRNAVRPLRDDASAQLRSLVGRLESLDDVRQLMRILEPAK